jgi:hypothetical protein
MALLNVSISADQLVKRIQDRLAGLSPVVPPSVVWQQKNNRALIYINSLRARMLSGWLLCNLDLQADETGRQTLQFVFFLEGADAGGGLRAGVTINAATPQASQLAQVWGGELQRVMWDAILDALEASVEQAGAQHAGQALQIQGFQAAPAGLQTSVLAGGQ